jgi:predicted hydrolase (HD superfamily)
MVNTSNKISTRRKTRLWIRIKRMKSLKLTMKMTKNRMFHMLNKKAVFRARTMLNLWTSSKMKMKE